MDFQDEGFSGFFSVPAAGVPEASVRPLNENVAGIEKVGNHLGVDDESEAEEDTDGGGNVVEDSEENDDVPVAGGVPKENVFPSEFFSISSNHPGLRTGAGSGVCSVSPTSAGAAISRPGI